MASGGDFDSLYFEALAGGSVNLSALAQLNTGKMGLVSDGTGRVLNVPSLTSFSSSFGRLQASNGGAIQNGNLTSLAGVDLPLDGVSTIATDQIASYTDGSMTVSGGSFTLSNLTDLDDANVTVEGGTSLCLPGITSYTHDHTANGRTLEATGAGSTLDLANLATVMASGGDFDSLYFEALAGGSVNLSALAQLNTGTIGLVSDGTGSVLDISSLTSFSSSSGRLLSSNGSTLLDGNLATLNGVQATLDGTDQQVANSWTQFTNGGLTVTGGSYTLDGLTDVDGSNLLVNRGGSLALPGLTGYTANNTTFQADGAGSEIGRASCRERVCQYV